MIPEFNGDGNLPPGIYWTTWQEFTIRFGTTYHRQRLLTGLHMALDALQFAGCRAIYVGGSFVTAKRVPNDFDVCWDCTGVDLHRLCEIDPVLLDFKNRHAAQKTKYLGELFVANCEEGVTGTTFLEFLQVDKETGKQKGIIALDLRRL